MDAKLFTNMISDKRFDNLKKMQYKYSNPEVLELIELLKSSMYTPLPINDFHGKPLVYLKNIVQLNMSTLKLLLTPQSTTNSYGIKAMEEEIHASLIIENIESSRDSIRKILNGYAPVNDSENKIYGMKKGLEFIADTRNKITEENLHILYKISVGDFMDDESKLLPSNYYRHDSVYIVGTKPEHQGLNHNKLPEYMKAFVSFINTETDMNDLLKAAVIHFYWGYVHPYFDGNGRTARLVHMWYLVQRGFPYTMFVPFSSYINETRNKYYEAYTLIEQNADISNVIDVTPFLTYFVENIYNKLSKMESNNNVIELFQQVLSEGKITEKEHDLWNFILSAYGSNEFSTKQLEKDFQNAAYATIRGFVLKFESLELLAGQKYGNKVKYRLSVNLK